MLFFHECPFLLDWVLKISKSKQYFILELKAKLFRVKSACVPSLLTLWASCIKSTMKLWKMKNNFEHNVFFPPFFYNAFKSKRSLKMIMCYWHACLRLDMTDATAWIIWTGVSPEVFIRSQHFDLFNKAQRINSSSQEQQVTGSMFGSVFVRDYSWGFATPRKKWNLKKERERNKNLSRLLWTVCFLQA